ncbi:hypothetical protein CTI12_AA181330 [Artemisia annua]|uniref:C2H2-type domain-containing protein n=1 Tax=Artemisia annua TaxID=35608 RepID=A0A2U1P8Q6_ARTAN|nr:hypothetical protein CTI12_AA181330 [Artemisia annua]
MSTEIITCIICKEKVNRETIREHFASTHPELLKSEESEESEEESEECYCLDDLFIEEEESSEECYCLDDLFVEEESSEECYCLDDLFVEEEETSAIGGGLIQCEWCPDCFEVLSSAITHVRLVHPHQFYILAAPPAVEPPADEGSEDDEGVQILFEPDVAAPAVEPPSVEGSEDDEGEEGEEEVQNLIEPAVAAAAAVMISCIVCNAQVAHQLIYEHFAAHHPHLPAVAPPHPVAAAQPQPVVAAAPPPGVIICVVCNAQVDEQMMDNHFAAEHPDQFYFFAGPPAVVPPLPVAPLIVAPNAGIILCIVCNAPVEHQMIQDHFVAEHPNLLGIPPPEDFYNFEESEDEEGDEDEDGEEEVAAAPPDFAVLPHVVAAPPHVVPAAPPVCIILCIICNAEVEHQMIQDHFAAEHPHLLGVPVDPLAGLI